MVIKIQQGSQWSSREPSWMSFVCANGWLFNLSCLLIIHLLKYNLSLSYLNQRTTNANNVQALFHLEIISVGSPMNIYKSHWSKKREQRRMRSIWTRDIIRRAKIWTYKITNTLGGGRGYITGKAQMMFVTLNISIIPRCALVHVIIIKHWIICMGLGKRP